MDMQSLNRREFLKAAGIASGSLVVSFYLPGPATSSATAQSTADGAFQPNAWLIIRPDNSMTFMLDKVEMGQGVTTALPMLIAEELNIHPKQLQVEFAPADRRYANSAMGIQITGGSTSIKTSFGPLREAGAVARQMLEAAAAKIWKVEAKDCRGEDGVILGPGDKTMTYGEAASTAATLSAQKPTLKARSDWRWIGKEMARLDAADKVRGAATFGIDVQLPNMAVAVIERGPRPGGKPKNVHLNRTLQMPGVKKVVPLPHGVAVIADSYMNAMRGANVLTLEWDSGPNGRVSTSELLEEYRRLATDPKAGKTLRDDGDTKQLLEKYKDVIEATYELPFLAHATMEPQNCTVHVTKDRCDVWAPTQSAGQAQQVAAEITGMKHSQVFIHTTYLGGGFGRRLAQDYVAEAVLIAKEVDYPVKLMWSREHDMQHSLYRPAAVHALRCALTPERKPVAWHHRVVTQSILTQTLPEIMRTVSPTWVPEWLKRVAGGGAATVQSWLSLDPTAVEGAEDTPYEFENLRVESTLHANKVPVGFWRSVGHSHTAFAVEGFMDEVAVATGMDPLTLRLRLLKKSPRYVGVLQLATERARWHAPLPTGHYRGLAVHKSFGSYVALVLEIAYQEGSPLRIIRGDFAVDCGEVVNPDIIAMQMESSMVFGLSAALYGKITLQDGAIEQSNFHDYPLLRMNQMPEVHTHIVDSREESQGVGEPGVPVVAPALVNALYAATKQRYRRLPLEIA